MSNGPGPGTGPHPPRTEKKGLSPLAWVAIGCLGVLVLGGVAATIAGLFVVGKVRDVAREMEEDPVATTARFIAAANPAIELVEADKESRTVTFRDERTGDEFTVSYDEIEQGKITFSSNGETTTLEVDTEGGDAGQVTIRSDEGTAEFRAGAEVADVPDWVPEFPGVTPRGSFSSQAGSGRAGAFSFETSETLEEVLAFYENGVGEAGLSVQSRTTTPDSALLVAGTEEGRGLSIVANRKDGSVEVVVNYTEKQ